MFVELLTPDKKYFEGEASGVKVPGINGEFEMLDRHANIISSLTKGEVRIAKGSEVTTFSIDGGTIEMLDNKLVILAEAVVG
ncbi:F0F1 ATP synthase subunit epsilon [Flammeovirga yaeyamensis]|uniref:F0F1 ATP synthase subunit epsilon n=1 Tax=Flammeovirga yaeyamensis TaxID=367791 RepID=A0AAX1N574_9BACT|nr:F0F1 ATP synthase subunit epsilon [Flammeovirga yaeyamensis]MBB3699820.1 F-type H+-transporting ATPase subunit epsilon [Flammeovirga yaeyamensis]NMF36611.1 F0F1 ATP synthase subunit epsilon [Flammeovirga yaeyamensis]QWG02342.1 F0F1 ATP synthase subunit epsilon [Flammeovirga yaeyamensis]